MTIDFLRCIVQVPRLLSSIKFFVELLLQPNAISYDSVIGISAKKIAHIYGDWQSLEWCYDNLECKDMKTKIVNGYIF